MANSVTFPEALGGNGQTYTDDANPDTGLDGLGYTVRFIPCLQQAVAMGLSAQSNAEAAAGFVQQCQTLRDEAAGSATAAAGSASTASTAASTATTKAGEASGSASAAADSASTASTAASTATTKAGEASGSASAAVDSASTASTAASTATTKAGEASGSASAAADSASTASTAANTATTAADESVQAKNDAQALYGDLTAVDAAKTEAQQAATLSGEERALAETARTVAEAAQAASEQAASTSQQAANAAVSEHVAKEDPHPQYAKEADLGEAAGRGVLGGGGDLMADGVYGAGGFINYVDVETFEAAYDSQTFRLPSSSWSPFASAGSGYRMQFSTSAAVDIFVGTSFPTLHHRRKGNNDGQWSDPILVRDTANTTVDSNGFIKQASPILRLSNFAEVSVSKEQNFKEAGAGAANGEAQGVTASHDDVGFYTVTGSLGFAAEGWTVEIPQDRNGNRLCVVETEQADDGTITVRTFSKKVDANGDVVANEPMDIPTGRWVDLRLSMPAPPTNDHPDEAPESPVPLTPEQEEQARIKQLERWRSTASITPRQARLVLAKNGLLTGVADAIAAIEDPAQRQISEIEWEYATLIERAAPWVNFLYMALGLTQEDVDSLFREAADL